MYKVGWVRSIQKGWVPSEMIIFLSIVFCFEKIALLGSRRVHLCNSRNIFKANRNNTNQSTNKWKIDKSYGKSRICTKHLHTTGWSAAEGRRPPLSSLVCFVKIHSVLYDVYMFHIFIDLSILFLFALHIFFDLHQK